MSWGRIEVHCSSPSWSSAKLSRQRPIGAKTSYLDWRKVPLLQNHFSGLTAKSLLIIGMLLCSIPWLWANVDSYSMQQVLATSIGCSKTVGVLDRCVGVASSNLCLPNSFLFTQKQPCTGSTGYTKPSRLTRQLGPAQGDKLHRCTKLSVFRGDWENSPAM